ncbi:MAG: hypothetical protein HYU55_15860 [Nocardioides sp.]|nr:hypothetical protein [Nocardioides sp.]
MNLAAHLLRRTYDRSIARMRRWPVESQLGARRNAMVAATALAQQRAERDEVEEFLAARRQPPAAAVAARAAQG